MVGSALLGSDGAAGLGGSSSFTGSALSPLLTDFSSSLAETSLGDSGTGFSVGGFAASSGGLAISSVVSTEGAGVVLASTFGSVSASFRAIANCFIFSPASEGAGAGVVGVATGGFFFLETADVKSMGFPSLSWGMREREREKE